MRGWLHKMLLYVHTARHLRFQQIITRVVRGMQPRVPRVSATHARVSELRASQMAERIATWRPEDTDAVLARAAGVVRGEFRFLQETRRLGIPKWNTRHVSHLWNYHLHYFDYALDLAWAARLTGQREYGTHFARLVDDWIVECKGGSDGWEPYPISVRTVNWIYAYLLLREQFDTAFHERFTHSLHRQLQVLDRRVEWHILANHVQKNLHALVIGGLFFDSADSKRWRIDRTKAAVEQLKEQLLADGMHYERSPLYHALALKDHLELVELTDATDHPLPDHARALVRSMMMPLKLLTRSNGELFAFNDTAAGLAPSTASLLQQAGRTFGDLSLFDRKTWSLPDAGYFGHRDPDNDLEFIIDCGEPGPAHQPGHAHCDLLSFEMSLAGQPIIVDTGVRGYADDDLRSYVRSTRAHNTIMLDDREQNEIWGSYRMARRAHAIAGTVHDEGGSFVFYGQYRPYHDRRALHERHVRREPGGEWIVEDLVTGTEASVDSFLHVHHEAEVIIEAQHVVIDVNGARIVIVPLGFDDFRVVDASAPDHGWHCPAFGSAYPAGFLRGRIRSNDGRRHGWRILKGSSAA